MVYVWEFWELHHTLCLLLPWCLDSLRSLTAPQFLLSSERASRHSQSRLEMKRRHLVLFKGTQPRPERTQSFLFLPVSTTMPKGELGEVAACQVRVQDGAKVPVWIKLQAWIMPVSLGAFNSHCNHFKIKESSSINRIIPMICICCI